MIIGKPLFTTEQIQSKVTELADRISRDYLGKEIVAVGILKGSFMFFSDLVRAIQQPVTIDFIVASSYIRTTSTGEVKVHYDVKEDLEGKNVLLVDDIIDTGISLNFLRERIMTKNPESVKVCTFLNKKERRIADVHLDYVGFEIPNVFVVGYGLDYEDRFRNLPYIAIFKKKT
jgi:hypoxanthine phosphoribosyltransferase